MKFSRCFCQPAYARGRSFTIASPIETHRHDFADIIGTRLIHDSFASSYSACALAAIRDVNRSLASSSRRQACPSAYFEARRCRTGQPLGNVEDAWATRCYRWRRMARSTSREGRVMPMKSAGRRHSTSVDGDIITFSGLNFSHAHQH